MNYFKAEICMMSELFVNNDRDQGCDPDTCQDGGAIETVHAKTLEDLIKNLNERYKHIEHFEENRLETGFEEMERDGTWVNWSVSIYLSEVKESEVKEDDILKILNKGA